MGDMEISSDIRQNLSAVKSRVEAAARDGERDPAAVTLVAISKTHDAQRIAQAIAAGHAVTWPARSRRNYMARSTGPLFSLRYI